MTSCLAALLRVQSFQPICVPMNRWPVDTSPPHRMTPGAAACCLQPAMDIYSCGVLPFILLTGRKPWNHSQVDNLEYGMMRLAEAPGLKVG